MLLLPDCLDINNPVDVKKPDGLMQMAKGLNLVLLDGFNIDFS